MSTLDTLTLDGRQLDRYTGLALGYEMFDGHPFTPTTSYDDLSVVLLQMRSVSRGPDGKNDWMVRADGCMLFARSTSLPVAVCRALVLAKFGAYICLPVAVAPDACEDLFA